jgi:hypothetical protein
MDKIKRKKHEYGLGTDKGRQFLASSMSPLHFQAFRCCIFELMQSLRVLGVTNRLMVKFIGFLVLQNEFLSHRDRSSPLSLLFIFFKKKKRTQNTCQTYLFQNHVYFQNEFYLEKYKKAS